MTPFLINEGSLWALGIAWQPEALAAFLAWWMPLNLISYLAALALLTWWSDAEWEPQVFYLAAFLLMTLFFLPLLLTVVVVAAVWATIATYLDARDNRKAYTIDWKTQGAR